jgi:hypothetical protein
VWNGGGQRCGPRLSEPGPRSEPWAVQGLPARRRAARQNDFSPEGEPRNLAFGGHPCSPYALGLATGSSSCGAAPPMRPPRVKASATAASTGIPAGEASFRSVSRVTVSGDGRRHSPPRRFTGPAATSPVASRRGGMRDGVGRRWPETPPPPGPRRPSPRPLSGAAAPKTEKATAGRWLCADGFSARRLADRLWITRLWTVDNSDPPPVEAAATPVSPRP